MHNQSAKGLKTSGGSYQTGYGIGKKLIDIAKHSVSDHSHSGVLGLSILHSLGHKLQKGEPLHNLIDKKALEHIRSYLKRIHGRASKSKIMEFIKQNEQKALHIKDLFGKDHKSKGKALYTIISGQRGGSFWKSLKGAVRKAGNKLGDFVKGKTKYKPHMLAHHLSLVTKTMGDLAAMIPDPRAKAVSMGLKTASKVLDPASKALKSVGRGTMPKYIAKHIERKPDEIYKIARQAQRGGSFKGATKTAQNI